MERTAFYTVLEIQNNGTPAVIPLVYTEMSQAYNKYYTILAAAAISEVPYHAGYILTDDGLMMEHRVFDRRTDPVPEPEPELEEEAAE